MRRLKDGEIIGSSVLEIERFDLHHSIQSSRRALKTLYDVENQYRAKVHAMEIYMHSLSGKKWEMETFISQLTSSLHVLQSEIIHSRQELAYLSSEVERYRKLRSQEVRSCSRAVPVVVLDEKDESQSEPTQANQGEVEDQIEEESEEEEVTDDPSQSNQREIEDQVEEEKEEEEEMTIEMELPSPEKGLGKKDKGKRRKSIYTACVLCQFQPKSGRALLKHLTKHTNTKHFKCSICGSEVRRKDNLKSHLTRIHRIPAGTWLDHVESSTDVDDELQTLRAKCFPKTEYSASKSCGKCGETFPSQSIRKHNNICQALS